MKQLIYLALAIVLGVLAIKLYTGRVSPSSGEDGWKTITPETAKARMDSGDALTILDVRTQEEFDGGHVPGALCLPVENITADTAAAALPDKAAEILVYCRSGRRSAEAAKTLAALGYTAVADFGGIIDWPYETVTE